MAKNFNLVLYEGDKAVASIMITPHDPTEESIPDYVCEDVKKEWNSLGYNVDRYEVVEVYKEGN